MSKGTYKNQCYMVIDVETDLPLVVLDRYRDVQEWLGVSSRTVMKLLRGALYNGMKVEKVFL